MSPRNKLRSSALRVAELRSEARAWRELAERFDGSYLCWWIDDDHYPVQRRDYRFASRSVRAAMTRRLAPHIGHDPDGLPHALWIEYETGRDHSLEVRQLLCLFFALECLDEARTAEKPVEERGEK